MKLKLLKINKMTIIEVEKDLNVIVDDLKSESFTKNFDPVLLLSQSEKTCYAPAFSRKFHCQIQQEHLKIKIQKFILYFLQIENLLPRSMKSRSELKIKIQKSFLQNRKICFQMESRLELFEFERW